MSGFFEIKFDSYDVSVPEILDMSEAGSVLKEQSAVLIKPNLINDSPYPVTTPVECCEALVRYIREKSTADIIIAEGCGSSSLETDQVFDRLGYRKITEDHGVELMDLNYAPLRYMEVPDCPVFPDMYLPEVLFTHYVISVPVLKAHSLSDITGSMKNMIGAAPPEHYSGRHGSWKKAVFHGDMHQSIIDLNRYRAPDFTLMDAAIGMAEFHLGGAHCDPPVNKLLAGFDARALDRRAAELLGFDWKSIPHLA